MDIFRNYLKPGSFVLVFFFFFSIYSFCSTNSANIHIYVYMFRHRHASICAYMHTHTYINTHTHLFKSSRHSCICFFFWSILLTFRPLYIYNVYIPCIYIDGYIFLCRYSPRIYMKMHSHTMVEWENAVCFLQIGFKTSRKNSKIIQYWQNFNKSGKFTWECPSLTEETHRQINFVPKPHT